MEYINKLVAIMKQSNQNENYIELCTRYASILLDNEVPVIFDFKHLALLLGYTPRQVAFYLFADECEFYNEFEIPKKNGDKRCIDVPSDRLKDIQRWILENILNKYQLNHHCVGFRKEMSIYDNALQHVSKPCVLNFDLKNFFPSITREDVFYIFYSKGYTKKVSYYLSKLVTKGNILPQGAPTSPMISNIVAYKLDKRLACLGDKYKASYTRYADDITFSGNENIVNVIPIVKKIVEDEGFLLNDAKTRYAYSYQRQEVTGLVVNKKVGIPKEYIRELEKEIFFCKKYGVTSHLQRIQMHKSFYKEHLYGKVYFVKMINPELGKSLLQELGKIKWEY